jgi:hypothetical protein
MWEMKDAKADLDEWKPTVNNCVTGLEQAINDLGDHFEHLLGGKPALAMKESLIEHPAPNLTPAGSALMLGSAHLGPTPSKVTLGPSGHHEDNRHWSARHGVVYTSLVPPPITGAMNPHQFTPIPFNLEDSTSRDHMNFLLFLLLPYLNLVFPNSMVQILSCVLLNVKPTLMFMLPILISGLN